MNYRESKKLLMKKINEVFLFVILIGIVVLSGCEKEDRSNEEEKRNYKNTSLYMIENELNNTKRILHKYDSPYTVCYENDDGTYLLYVFASPIQYKINNAYKIIDNTIITSSKEGYAFENKANNIKTYFPDKVSNTFLIMKENEYIAFTPNFDVSEFMEGNIEIIQNMQGMKVEAVVYKSKKMDLCFYPIKSGIKLEIIIKEKLESKQLDFVVKSSSDDFSDNENGYVVFTKSEKNQAVIYSSLQEKKYDMDSVITFKPMIEKKEGECHVYFSINNINEYSEGIYPLKMTPSFEFYQSKMPDTTVYSKYLTNSYLNNYAVLGESSVLGEGLHYVRVRLQFFMSLAPEKIKKATFNSKCLMYNDSEGKIKIMKNDEQWSSTQMNWKSRVCNHTLIGEYAFLNGYLEADITEFVKECFSEPSLTIESQGFMLKAENQCIIATSENAMYTPYIKLVLNSEPLYFEAKDDINKNMNY